MVKTNIKKTSWERSTKTFSRRSVLLLSTQMAVIGVLGWRIRKLQIEESERYRLLAEENRVNIRILPPQRGLIYDKSGKLLAKNQANYRIGIISEEAGDVKKVLFNLSKLIPITKTNLDLIEKEVKKYRAFIPVTVVEDLSWREFAKVAANLPSLPGIVPEVGFSRAYEEKNAMAHVIGYVGPISKKDQQRFAGSNPLFQIPNLQIGKTGIERELNSELMGVAGVSRSEVNANGRIMRELDHDVSQAGKDIQITVDTDLQKFSMARMSGLSASTVVMDLDNGAIRAMASTPSFDPNILVNGISTADWSELLNDVKRPLSNKAVSDAYPPGSLFKMIVAIAALEKKIVSEYEQIKCTGIYETNASKHHCWLVNGHKDINLEKALKRSCDVFFYEISKRVGIDDIAKTAKMLGLSDTYNLPVSAVSKGLIPNKEWKKKTYNERWLLGDTLNAGIGQGYILTTPLQIAVMIARIATGKTLKPKLINAKGGKIIPVNRVKSLNLSIPILNQIRSGMEGVVNDRDGTAYKSRIVDPNLKFAGKTGTAQVRRITEEERKTGVKKNEELPWSKRDHALFTGYAPADKPKYAISVVVEHGGGGSAVAAPIARDIMLFALQGKYPSLSAYPKDQRSEIKIRLNKLKGINNPHNENKTLKLDETQT